MVEVVTISEDSCSSHYERPKNLKKKMFFFSERDFYMFSIGKRRLGVILKS